MAFTKKKDKKPGGIKKWFKETKNELKKVSWPTAQRTANNSLIVFCMILFFGSLVWLFDAGFMKLLNIVFNR